MTQFAHGRNPRDVTKPANSLTRAKAIALAAAALVLGALVVLWPEVPQWRLGGTRSSPASSASRDAHALACPQAGTGIAIIGDSHVAGGRMEETGAPFGAVLEEALPDGVTVQLYGIGGATAADGEQRWGARDLANAGPVILAFGTNDAAPRGWLRDKQPVPLAAYKASLARQIANWRARGHDVALLAPPPGGSAAIAARIAPYRLAASDVGRNVGAPVFDPADAFAACPAEQPVLTFDALHMNASGHRCLGKWLAHQICPPAR